MKLPEEISGVFCKVLLGLFCVMPFFAQNISNSKDSSNDTKGYLISASKLLSGSITSEDHSTPCEDEEDEDDEDANEGESSCSRSYSELLFSVSYEFHQDRLFCDLHAELISPPPKS